jgi:hypothetical protein
VEAGSKYTSGSNYMSLTYRLKKRERLEIHERLGRHELGRLTSGELGRRISYDRFLHILLG